VKSSSFYGMFSGCLLLGLLGDKFGRKRLLGLELITIMVCTLGTVLTASAVNGPLVLYGLCVWRFLLGFGAGGVLPSAMVLLSEISSKKNRGFIVRYQKLTHCCKCTKY
jgi:MFS transporter, PHS family, inorganic phosphate transporter